MNPALLRFAAGLGIGIAVVRIAKKPLRSLAVATTRGAINTGHRVTNAGNSIKEGFSGIVQEARQQSQDYEPMVNNAMEKGRTHVASYMHKTAETIEDMAAKVDAPTRSNKSLDYEEDNEEE